MDKEVHEIQAGILKELLLKKEARFSELNIGKVPTDQFTFHLKQLAEHGVVEKTSEGLYRLTTAGKEYANRFDIDSGPVKFERQAKVGVLVIATRKSGGTTEYLMQERHKHPFFGFRGFITGKVKIGESIAETAKRELREETGLTAEVEPKAIQHERIFSKGSNNLLEDKNFFIFAASNPTGNLIEKLSGGWNQWIAEDDVLKGNIFYEVADLVALMKTDHYTFSERSYFVDEY